MYAEKSSFSYGFSACFHGQPAVAVAAICTLAETKVPRTLAGAISAM